MEFLTGLSETDVIKNYIQIQPNFTLQTIVASNTMTVKSKVPALSKFQFELDSALTITQMTVNGSPATWSRLNSKTVEVTFAVPFTMDQQFTLYIAYSGSPASSFFGSFEWFTHNSQIGVCTLSEPYYSYTWWPVKEDNTDKALLDMDIIVPSTMLACTSGVRQSITNIGGGLNRHRWVGSNPMSPYLVSFSATNYNEFTDTYTGPGGPMPLQFFIYPETNTTTNRNNWLQVKGMIQTFSGLYGNYPFLNEKYGIYQFPFGGGMEHQTMTGQGGSGFTGTSLSAHELAHQWWGDMVTCGTWSDIWLNESFATYSEALYYEWQTGTSNLTELKTRMASRKPSTTNGSVYCYDVSDPNRIFSSDFSYRKGAWVLHALRKVMGDTAYFQALALYRSRFQYKTAVTNDLIQACEDVYGEDLNWFFDNWVYGIGAPAYNWGWTTTVVNGKRYLLASVRQTQTTSYPTFKMPIELRATVGGVPTSYTIWQNSRSDQNFVIPVSNTVSAASLDPDAWILWLSNTAGGYVAGAPKIVETSFKPNARFYPSTAPTEYSMVFHVPVTATAADFTLTRDGVAIPFTFSYTSAENRARITPTGAMQPGEYRLTVKDTVKATSNNQALDGENAAVSLPSGNGLAGGNAVLGWHVRGRFTEFPYPFRPPTKGPETDSTP